MFCWIPCSNVRATLVSAKALIDMPIDITITRFDNILLTLSFDYAVDASCALDY